MQDYTVIIKNSQVLIAVDSGLFKELLDLAIYAKKQLEENDPTWNHSPELYEEMLANHKKVMEKAIHLPRGIQTVSI